MAQSSHDVLLNQLADEFAARQRNGERPLLDEYCERHPSLAADIRLLFPAMLELEQVKADASAELAAENALPITQLGDFRLLREVGRGGMGVVYEAEQVSLGRRVAIKILPASVFREPAKRRRFEREAKAAARLHHTNIVPVHGFGEHHGTPYYVMQFIPGLGLDAVIDELAQFHIANSAPSRLPSADAAAVSVLLARSLLGNDVAALANQSKSERASATLTVAGQSTPGPAPSSRTDCNSTITLSTSGVHLPGQSGSAMGDSSGKKSTYWESVARIGVQVAGALAYAHKQGVLHRDIKPGNLLLDLDGIVWVTDFGLAKADDTDNLTRTGDLLGTLRYMPPEAFDGKSDARSDIYSLGLTLFELVALRPAYVERDRNKMIKRVTTGDPPRLRKLRKDAPRDLVTIIEKAVDRDPNRRYQTAADLTSDLQRFLDDQPIRARRQSTAETIWRWARQHRSITSLAVTVLLLLVAITVGSLIAAAYFRDQERVQRGLLQTKVALAERNHRLAEENEAAKKKAEDARKQAEITLVEMEAWRGLMAAERDDSARAVLWFARAAEQAASDPTRQADNLLRARNWARHLTVPVRAFPTGGPGQPVRVLEFRPGGDLLLLLAQDHLFVRDWREERFLPWCDDVGKVGAACWSTDGTRLAIGYNSGVVQIRDVPDGKILLEVSTASAITALAFSADGKVLAIAGTKVRDWGNAKTILPWDIFQPNIACLLGETVVQLLDLSSGAILPAGWKHPQPVHSLAFNRAGDRLITASIDKKARVFAIADPGKAEARNSTSAPLFEPVPHAPRYHWPPVLVANDRQLITVSVHGAGKSSELTCWDAETGKPTGRGAFPARPTNPTRVVASPAGDWFATAGHWGPEVWKTTDQRATSLYFSEHTGYVEDFVSSPDGKTILSASWDQTARLWSVPNGKPLGSPLPHMGIVTRCAVDSDNIHLATLADGVVRVWRRPDADIADVQPANWRGITRPSFDRRLFAPGIWHEQANVFAPIGGGQLLVYTANAGTAAGPAIALPGGLVDSCICADNRTVAAVSEEKGAGWLTLNDIASGQVVKEPIRLPGSPRSVAARPSSTHVAVLCAGGELVVFDHRSGERVLDLNHDGQAAAWRTSRLEYTPDGNTLVSLTGEANAMHVRDAHTGRLRFPPIRPVLQGGPLRTFALSPDSRMLATAVNGKNAAQVWDLASGSALSGPLPHPGDHFGLFCLCFSADGRRLLTGCKDGQARLWDWQTASLVCPPLKHDGEVFALALTPDGRFALTAGRELASKLHVWELSTGRLVASKIPLPINVVSIFTADSRVVASSLGSVARIDLAKLFAVPERSIDEYRLLGELASGQRIEHGDESGLTQDEWLERLRRFQQRPSPR